MSPDATPSNDDIVLTLSHAHALTLYEFLSRYSGHDRLEICDQAEQRVLWDMCCDLERVLVEPLRDDYQLLLERARDIVRDPQG